MAVTTLTAFAASISNLVDTNDFHFRNVANVDIYVFFEQFIFDKLKGFRKIRRRKDE